MLPAREFSIGIKADSHSPAWTASKTASKDSHGCVSTSPKYSNAACSEYAPGSPWKAIFIRTPLIGARSLSLCSVLLNTELTFYVLCPLDNLSESFFHLFLRRRNGHAHKAFALSAERRAGDKPYSGFFQNALANFNGGHFERTHIQEKIERTQGGCDQHPVAFQLARDSQNQFAATAIRGAHLRGDLLLITLLAGRGEHGCRCPSQFI